MISDQILKRDFLFEKLKRTAESAYSFHLNSFNANRKSKTGSTLRALSTPLFVIQAEGTRLMLSAKITKQMRFQDFGFRRLYNKPLFGTLSYTYATMRDEVAEQIKENLGKELQDALNPQ